MRIYDVYNHHGLQGTVTVHDDGRKTWETASERHPHTHHRP
jgi:hypothetical protein